MIFTALSESDTAAAAREVAGGLSAGTSVLLYGDLGSGKTVFARSLIRELTGFKGEIPSPTFSLLQEYGDVAHYDLYRLGAAAELDELDFFENLRDKICIIEWPEIAEPFIKNAVQVRIKIVDGGREIVVE